MAHRRRRRSRKLSGSPREHEEIQRYALHDAWDDFYAAEEAAKGKHCGAAFTYWNSGVAHYAVHEANLAWSPKTVGSSQSSVEKKAIDAEAAAKKALLSKCFIKSTKLSGMRKRRR